MCETPKEYAYLEAILMQNYTEFTDIYHYLQSKSTRYPWVTYYAVRKEFFMPAVGSLGYSLESAVFDAIIREANFEKDRDESIANCVNRQEFIEFCVLLSRFLFTTKLDRDDYKVGMAYYGVSIPKAV